MIITQQTFKNKVMIPGLTVRPESHDTAILGKKSHNTYYIPILKNAHTWGVEFFKENYDFEVCNENTLFNASSDARIIVFLREPIDRWYSGIAQYFYMYMGLDPDKEHILDDYMLKLIFSAVSLDGHTDLQINSILGVNMNNCAFFNIDDQEDFDFKFHTFLMKRNLGPIKKMIQPNNISKNFILKQSIIDQLKIATKKDPSLLHNVTKHYEQDCQLFHYLSLRKWN